MLCIFLVEFLWAQGKGMYLHTCIVSASKALYMLECAFVWHRIDVFQNPLLECIGCVILENLFGSWSLWPKSCHLWLLLPLIACLTNHKWNDSLKSINSYVSLYHISYVSLSLSQIFKIINMPNIWKRENQFLANSCPLSVNPKPFSIDANIMLRKDGNYCKTSRYSY